MKYLVFDKALHDEYAFLILSKSFTSHESLFKDTDDEKLMEVAPYIFQIPEDWKSKIEKKPHLKLQHFLIIDSEAPLTEFRKHLQQFIYQNIGEALYYFRIWDGYVLEKFLPTCKLQQLQLFYKKIEHIRCEDWTQNLYFDFNVIHAKVVIEKYANHNESASHEIVTENKAEDNSTIKQARKWIT